MSGPLEGFRVVDCSRGLAGPRATGLLADYGAEVWWVEPPGGDPYRDVLATEYAVFNRGKRSVQLDLKSSGGRDALFDLLSSADIFVTSWRPGVAERLGVDWGRFTRLSRDWFTRRFPGSARTARWPMFPATRRSSSRTSG